MAALIGLVIGALIGGLFAGSGGASAGGVIGFVIGVIILNQSARKASPTNAPGSDAALAQRVAALESRVAGLEYSLRSRGAAELVVPAPMPPTAIDSALPDAGPVLPVPQAARAMPAAIAADSVASALNPDGTRPPSAAVQAPPFPQRAVPESPNLVWAWLVGGNTLARIGVLLLFIGVGFLLKYAAEHVHVPISVRLAGVALGGVALLVVGWRLRSEERR